MVDAGQTTNGHFPWPGDGDVAAVPQDIKDVCDQMEAVLYGAESGRPWTSQINGRVPGPILIIQGTAANLPTTAADNTIAFVYQP